MNETQYQALCEACDRVLLAPNPTIERIAIPWLHVLNEHPVNVAKYTGMFAQKQIRSLVELKRWVSTARQWIKSHHRPYTSDQVTDSADIIFISHLLNESQVGGSEDFYFGRLPEVLKEEGLSSCVVLNNCTTLDPFGLGMRWPKDMAPRLVLSNTLSGREEMVIQKRLDHEARRLRAESIHINNPLQISVYKEAARQAVSGSSIATLRFFYQILNLVEQLRPRAMVVTFEGHAWERLAFAAARKVNPDVRCIGYHHTMLFPRQHAALRLIGNEYDPDVVLTAGDISSNRFRKAYNSDRIKVATIGIHRRHTRGIDNRIIANMSEHGNCCLVVPDAMIVEIVHILDFAIASAIEVPDIQFILRLHPAMPFRSLRKQFPRFGKLPPNVEFSKAAIQDDISRSRWVLYRSSNAAIFAAMSGLRPFYIAKDNELQTDCLHELRTWKKIISTPREFVHHAMLDLKTDSRILNEESAMAVDYCKKYFMPLNLEPFFSALRG